MGASYLYHALSLERFLLIRLWCCGLVEGKRLISISPPRARGSRLRRVGKLPMHYTTFDSNRPWSNTAARTVRDISKVDHPAVARMGKSDSHSCGLLMLSSCWTDGRAPGRCGETTSAVGSASMGFRCIADMWILPFAQ